VNAAVEAGAELWEGCTVDELLTDDSGVAGPQVRGIRGHLRGGRTVSATATVVVGADGTRSPTAARVGASTYLARPARQGTYFTYWSGLPSRVNTLYPRPYRSVVTIPTNDDLTLVAVNWTIDDYRAARHDIESHYHRTIAQVAPELAEQLRGGHREDRWIGAALPSYFRRPHGPGWALVGDAGYLKDPCTAQGITDAFHHAELLAEALDAGLRGERALDQALAGYQRRRDAAVRPMYEFTCARAGLQPAPPQTQALLGALRDDPTATERFFGVFAGTVPVEDFFPAASPAA
jgi:flavin-dependent dehydrogenase